MIAAFLDTGIMADRYLYILPLLLFSLGLGYFGFEVLFGKTNEGKVFAVIAIPFTIFWLNWLMNLSAYSDPIALQAVAVAVHYIVSNKDRSSCDDILVVTGMMLASSFLLKPLAIPALVIYTCTIAYLALRHAITSASVMRCLALPSIAAALFVAHNLLLTGYPIFPISLFPVDFQWTVDKSVPRSVSTAVWGWARWPGNGYEEALAKGITYWFPSWLERQAANTIFWYGTVIPITVGMFLSIRFLVKKILTLFGKILLLFIFTSLAYWFMSTPDARFGADYFWLALAVPVSLAIIYGDVIIKKPYIFLSDIFSPKLLFAAVLLLAVVFSVKMFAVERRFITEHILLCPAIKDNRIVKELQGHFTDGREYIYNYPENGDRCGHTQLPCIPYPMPICASGQTFFDGFVSCRKYNIN
jgi:hypothetical protein